MISSRICIGRRITHEHRPPLMQSNFKRREVRERFIETRVPLRLVNVFGGKKEDESKEGNNNKNPFSNFSELMKTAQAAQTRASVEAQKAQEELSKKEIFVYSSTSSIEDVLCSRQEYAGYDEEETVKVVMSGNQEPVSVELTEIIRELDLEDLENRLCEAMQDAHSKSVAVEFESCLFRSIPLCLKAMKSRMKQLYADLGFPLPPKIQD